MSRVVSRWMLGGCASAGVLCPAGAAGQPLPPITIHCDPLDVERTAEVEARIRALLLTVALPVAEVTISCTAARGQVVVTTDQAAAHADVVSDGSEWEERLLDGVDSALRDLKQPGPVPADATPRVAEPKAPAVPPAAPPGVTSTAVRPAPPTPPAAPASGKRTVSAHLEVVARASLERWTAGTAIGAGAQVRYGRPVWQGSFSLAASKLLPSAPAFRVRELHFAFALGWAPRWGWGVRADAGMGLSLLAVSPNQDFAPRGGTTPRAAFAELVLSRPFWASSQWGVGPRIGARGFAASRSVTVDAEEALVVAGVVPSLGIELLYRTE